MLVLLNIGLISGYAGHATAGSSKLAQKNDISIETIKDRNWRTNFSQVSRVAYQGDTGLNNFTKNEGKISFQGTVRVPNPCYKLKPRLEKSSKNSYTYLVEKTMRNNSGRRFCTQQVVYQSYNASFASREDFELVLKHSDNEIKRFEVDTSGSKRRNILSNLMNKISNLL